MGPLASAVRGLLIGQKLHEFAVALFANGGGGKVGQFVSLSYGLIEKVVLICC